jgi:hypothetical protein
VSNAASELANPVKFADFSIGTHQFLACSTTNVYDWVERDAAIMSNASRRYLIFRSGSPTTALLVIRRRPERALCGLTHPLFPFLAVTRFVDLRLVI